VGNTPGGSWSHASEERHAFLITKLSILTLLFERFCLNAGIEDLTFTRGRMPP
jgi:hypothetical protein